VECAPNIRFVEHDEGGKNSREIEQQQQKAMEAQYGQRSGETEEQTSERIQRDPDIMAILQDPVMQSILNQAKGRSGSPERPHEEPCYPYQNSEADRRWRYTTRTLSQSVVDSAGVDHSPGSTSLMYTTVFSMHLAKRRQQ